INGVANDATSGNTSQSFFRLATLFRSLQRTGAVTLMMRVLPTKERQPVLAFVTRNQAPQILPDQAELKKLLRVKEDANEFQLTFGARALEETEIAVQTRSLLQILTALSLQVDVPPADEAQGVAVKGGTGPPGAPAEPRLFEVKSADSRLAGAHAAIR